MPQAFYRLCVTCDQSWSDAELLLASGHKSGCSCPRTPEPHTQRMFKHHLPAADQSLRPVDGKLFLPEKAVLTRCSRAYPRELLRGEGRGLIVAEMRMATCPPCITSFASQVLPSWEARRHDPLPDGVLEQRLNALEAWTHMILGSAPASPAHVRVFRELWGSLTAVRTEAA